MFNMFFFFVRVRICVSKGYLMCSKRNVSVVMKK